MRAPDAAFADPRLAALYDHFEDERDDLDAYEALVDELGAHSVVDIGCGTGVLALRLAARGLSVVGVDPATASLDLARRKPYAEQVTWVDGDATALGRLGVQADLAVMTGNVAQVFVTDEDWSTTLEAVHDALRPGGWLVFETRDPARRAWEGWDVPRTTVTLPDGSPAETERQVTEVALPLVTFEGATTIDGVPVRSTSTLRFRERDELVRDLDRHGYAVRDVRDAPDRPGLEWVFVAQRVD